MQHAIVVGEGILGTCAVEDCNVVGSQSKLNDIILWECVQAHQISKKYVVICYSVVIKNVIVFHMGCCTSLSNEILYGSRPLSQAICIDQGLHISIPFRSFIGQIEQEKLLGIAKQFNYEGPLESQGARNSFITHPWRFVMCLLYLFPISF